MVNAVRVGGHEQGAGLSHRRSMTMRRLRDSLLASGFPYARFARTFPRL